MPWEGQGLMTNAANWLSHTTIRSGRNMWGPKASAPQHHQNSFFLKSSRISAYFSSFGHQTAKVVVFFHVSSCLQPPAPAPSSQWQDSREGERPQVPYSLEVASYAEIFQVGF